MHNEVRMALVRLIDFVAASLLAALAIVDCNFNTRLFNRCDLKPAPVVERIHGDRVFLWGKNVSHNSTSLSC